MDYKAMKIGDIVNWCVANKQVDWLKKISETTYPVLTKDGEPVLDKKGNPKIRKISFIEIKLAFVEKFMPEIAPEKKPKKPTMYEIIANL